MIKSISSLVLASALTFGIPAFSQANSKAGTAQTARGKYLVNDVGLCGDCHTPMDKTGMPVKGQYLQGSPLFFKPTVPIPGWMSIAPRIAGLPSWTKEQGITFFMTGKKPNGAMAAPPMPAFRFNKADATNLTVYLKSLGSEPKTK